MEFTLTISQKQIHENFPTLDIKDAAIIDFLGKFSHECDKKVSGKTIYYWFAYSKICDECPLLRLDPESVRRRMRGLCGLKILVAHPENRGGKVFFAFGEKYSLTHREKSEKGRAENPELQKRSGRKSRPHRAENPELSAKGRADLTDNHNNQLDHNNQSSTVGEVAADTADFLIESTTEFEGVTLVEKVTVEAEEKESPKVALKGSYSARPAPGESAQRRWDAFDIDGEAEWLKSDETCRDRFGRDLHISLEKATADFPVFVDDFVSDQKSTTYNYQNTKQFRTHFFNWIVTAPKAKSAARFASSSTTPQSSKAHLNRLGENEAHYHEPALF